MNTYCDLCECELDTALDGTVTECGTHVCELCCEAHVIWDHSIDGEQFAYINEESL